MAERAPAGPRCAVIVGPQGSGKTTLFEHMLHVCGAIPRAGRVEDGTSVGDASDEARARGMSVEVNVARATWLEEDWCFIDTPGSVEFQQEALNALQIADVAVIVCEPDPARVHALAPLFHALEDAGVPHVLYVNKMDTVSGRVRDLLAALQETSRRPLVLRQVPIREGEDVAGYVDLASERAYRYREGEASELIQLPDSARPREAEARQEMLEALADFDDALLEQLLEDAVPETDAIYTDLGRDLADDLIVPVLLGRAAAGGGVTRLLKALRHEAPDVATCAMRHGVEDHAAPLALVFKTQHQPHAGKQSLARILAGEIADGATLNGQRLGGILAPFGDKGAKAGQAGAGEVVALQRLEETQTGETLTPEGDRPAGMADWPAPLAPVFSRALAAEKRDDEVKLSAALAKLVEEDPSLSWQQSELTGELLLWGQGEQHLRLAAERLSGRFNVGVTLAPPHVPYRETIRKGVSHHARFKRQSGGHGQFGDVHLEIKPLDRGAGFRFGDRISGGVVPKQYIPAVEAGVREYLRHGPLGFPVVDVEVTLTDGQYHAVDSSEQAFKSAGRLCMSEALPGCEPVLLEPIMQVEIAVPSAYTPKVQRLVSSRRGQILGFDARPDWPGWDVTVAQMPQAEIGDMIQELRSLSFGVGTYEARFERLQELTGKQAERVLKTEAAAAS